MRVMILMCLIAALSAPVAAQPGDAIATADPGAVDATATARMEEAVTLAIRTSTPAKAAHEMVQSFVLAVSSRPLPSGTGTVDLSAAWPLFQAMTARVWGLVLINSFEDGSYPPIDDDALEWGLIGAAGMVDDATALADLEAYHRIGMRRQSR